MSYVSTSATSWQTSDMIRRSPPATLRAGVGPKRCVYLLLPHFCFSFWVAVIEVVMPRSAGRGETGVRREASAIERLKSPLENDNDCGNFLNNLSS